MTALDWICVAVLLGSVALGMWRGLIVELVAVLGWIAAFVLAQMFGERVGLMLPMTTSSDMLRYAAGFAVVFVGTVFAAALLGWLLRLLAQAVGLRPADRLLGSVFGLARGGVMLLAFTVLVLATPLRHHEWWVESNSGEWLVTALRGLQSMWPGLWPEFLSV